jgi:hypothetical protein
MRRFTFRRYDSRDCKMLNGFNGDIFQELPVEYLNEEYQESIARDAGFALDEVRGHIGALDREWNGHPRRSIVVTPSWNCRPGQPFAVSNEQVWNAPKTCTRRSESRNNRKTETEYFYDTPCPTSVTTITLLS